jgi:YegS/Rv2252/BmrU family lipid kinase
VKPLLVVNPRSGGGATGRTFGAMRGAIERALGPVAVEMTERPGHGADLAREGAAAGHELVVAVGGDGTLHEVVCGLMRAKRETRLGVIAQGTGGDFRRSLGLEHRLDRYLEALTSGRERTIDVGRFEGAGKNEPHHFVNLLSVGMGGLVDRYVATASRALGGTAAYFGASLRALVTSRLGNVRVKVESDGASQELLVRSYMIAICNGQYFGSGMHVAPMASLDDGTFDLVALGARSKIGFALSSSSIYSGAHMRNADTVHLRGQRFELELVNDDARDVYLTDVDGEPMGSLPLRIEVMPKALVLRA